MTKNTVPGVPTRLLSLARRCAPPIFVLLVLSRSWLEMSFFSPRNRFSYYTALHHLAWYASTMLLILLMAHLILKTKPSHLLPLLYGIVVAAIPLLYSLVKGETLNLEYLQGSPAEIIRQILTLSLSEPRNHPLVPELFLIIFGMGALAYFLSGNLKKAVLMSAATWVSISLTGLTWFGLPGAPHSVLHIHTRLLRPQALQAAAWVCVATILTGILILREGHLDRGRRSWLVAGLAAAEIWIFWVLLMSVSGWLPHPFDSISTGIFPATATMIIIRMLRKDRKLVPSALLALWCLILGIHAAIFLPIMLHRESSFYRRKHMPVQKIRGAFTRSFRDGRSPKP